jgi:hypothetical protein
MMEEARTCFLMGKWFATVQEMLDYEQQWKDLPVDIRQFAVFLAQRLKEAEQNLSANPEFSNRTLYRMLRQHTEWTEQ